MAILQGIQGIQGVDTKSQYWRGLWNSGSNYLVDDIVYYQGFSYVAKLQHTNQTPIDNGIYWNKLQVQDVQGIQGISIQTITQFQTPGQATLFKADNSVAIAGATGPGVTTGGGGSFTSSDIEFDYSPHLNAIIKELHSLNETHAQMLKALTVLANNSNVVATNLINIADNQTVIAHKQTTIASDTTVIRKMQERMRLLADTTGITTRSVFDYLHIHSTLKGLEVDGQGVGDALRSFASVPTLTNENPDPTLLPPAKQSNLDWKGPWDEKKEYYKNDVVFQLGKSYVSLKNNKGSPPGDNQIWKLMDDKAIIESEKAKEIWKGTWEKTKTYQEGNIVSWKDGLQLPHIKGLEDLLYDATPAKLYKAVNTVQAFDFSGLIPTDELDVNGEAVWEPVEHDIPPNKAETTTLSGVQILSNLGDFSCNPDELAKLEIDGPVIVEKIPYNIDDFVTMYRNTYAASVYKAKAVAIMPIYTSNEPFTLSTSHTEPGPGGTTITVQDIRFGLARYPDHAGLAYWTNQCLANNWELNSQGFIDAFFAASDSTADFTRHLRVNKKFISKNTGGGFYDEPNNWTSGGTGEFSWDTRNITTAAPKTHPAWGDKINQYAIWEKSGTYNPIVRPVTIQDGFYRIGVGQPIQIKILGGPPNSTVNISKTADRNGFFGQGYVAGTPITGSVVLDTKGNFTDQSYTFMLTGTAVYTATFAGTGMLNGNTRQYTVVVQQAAVELPLGDITRNTLFNIKPYEDWTKESYQIIKNLNVVGYEFSREATINFPFDGSYIFRGWTDNWAKVTLDNVTILDFNNNFTNVNEAATKVVTVKKGNHIIKVSCINVLEETEANPGGIGVLITAGGGGGKINGHKGSKRYKIASTNKVDVFKLVYPDGAELATTAGPGSGYIYYVEKKMPNPNITEIQFKGCWEQSTQYKIHEKVLHFEKTWIALIDNTNNEPNPDSRYWREITTDDAAFIDDPPLWKGAWNNDTTYVKNSLVSYIDKTWIAKKLVPSIPTPPPPDQAPNDWKIVDDPAIHCEAPDAPIEPPVPPITPDDTTLTFEGPYEVGNYYAPYDVVSTVDDNLVFFDPPKLTNTEVIEDIVLDGADPDASDYDSAKPYSRGEVVLSIEDDEYYIVLDPTQAGETPTTKPTSYGRLLPSARSTYKNNDILPLLDPITNQPIIDPDINRKVAYIKIGPSATLGTRPLPVNGKRPSTPPSGWAEIDPTGALRSVPLTSDLWKQINNFIGGDPIDFLGPWDWRTNYSVNDVVIFCNILYRAIQDSIGAVPPYNINDISDTVYQETKWVRLSIVVSPF